jgi:hypothetical protein
LRRRLLQVDRLPGSSGVALGEVLLITHRQKLEAVSEACILANPDFLRKFGTPSGELARVDDHIRLSDVNVLLMKDFSDRRCNANMEALSFWWNLRSDALASQSDACVGFLYDTLWYLNR